MYIDNNNVAPVAINNTFPLIGADCRERRRWIIGAAALTLGLVGALMLAGCPADAPTYPYICTNGTPAAGTNASARLERCAACDAADHGVASTGQCAPIGSAIAVGAAVAFSVGETFPTGLAAIGDTLYMVGITNARLYTLDTNTGVATPMGTATEFGVGETFPTGLAAIGDTLYLVGESNSRLYTLDPNTGTATRVGTATNFGSVGESGPTGLAAIDDTLYMAGRNLYLYTVDRGAGTAARVGTTVPGFAVSESNPSGLAAIDDTLYMIGLRASLLYTLDIDTTSSTAGSATRVGSQMRFGVNEANPLGLAAIGDTLYMVGGDTDQLYTLVLP